MTELPRVTEVLRGVGLIDIDWIPQLAMDRGTAVHEATAYDDMGELDEATVDARVAPYLAAWRKFRAESKVKITDIETRVEHKAYGYVGHADRAGVIGGRLIVLDIKTGGPAPWHGLQLAGYALALIGRLTLAGCGYERADVYLRDDATYRLVRHEDETDGDAWLAALSLFNWKRRHNLIPREIRND